MQLQSLAALAGLLATTSSAPVIQTISIATTLQQSPILTMYNDETCSTAPEERNGAPFNHKTGCFPLDAAAGVVMNFLLPFCSGMSSYAS